MPPRLATLPDPVLASAAPSRAPFGGLSAFGQRARLLGQVRPDRAPTSVRRVDLSRESTEHRLHQGPQARSRAALTMWIVPRITRLRTSSAASSRDIALAGSPSNLDSHPKYGGSVPAPASRPTFRPSLSPAACASQPSPSDPATPDSGQRTRVSAYAHHYSDCDSSGRDQKSASSRSISSVRWLNDLAPRGPFRQQRVSRETSPPPLVPCKNWPSLDPPTGGVPIQRVDRDPRWRCNSTLRRCRRHS